MRRHRLLVRQKAKMDYDKQETRSQVKLFVDEWHFCRLTTRSRIEKRIDDRPKISNKQNKDKIVLDAI